MTLKIALDVDSVLADVIIPWNKNYKKLYGKILKKSDINTWDFWKKLELNNEQLVNFRIWNADFRFKEFCLFY